MNDSESPEAIIRLPSTFDEQSFVIKTIQEQFKEIQHPGELDAATIKMGKPASLLNFYFATTVDLSSIGLGAAIYIPAQITEREGGRKSVYFLDQNEEVLAGIYVTTSQGIALRFVKRETGSNSPAQIGDVYSTRITNREGMPVFEDQAKLQKFDPLTGVGHFDVPDDVPVSPMAALASPKPEVSLVSLLWSTIVYQPDQWPGL